jgi:hypothetical protein
MEKLIHPSPHVLRVDGKDDEAVNTAMFVLHNIGLWAQRGMPDRMITFADLIYSQDPESLVRACAHGSAALHNHLARKVEES